MEMKPKVSEIKKRIRQMTSELGLKAGASDDFVDEIKMHIASRLSKEGILWNWEWEESFWGVLRELEAKKK